jgi:MFS family permease
MNNGRKGTRSSHSLLVLPPRVKDPFGCGITLELIHARDSLVQGRCPAGRDDMIDYMKDYKVISMLGFFRTFSGGIIGTGIAIFILNYWGSYYWSGVSSAAIALPYIFATVICGRVSDKIGRRNCLVIATVSNFAIAFGCISDVAMNCCNDGQQDQIEGIARRGQGIYNLGWSMGVLCGQVILSTMSLANFLDVALFVPLATQGVNVIIVLLFFRVVMDRSDGAAAVPETNKTGQSSHQTLVGRHVLRPGLVVALIGLVMIYVYGFALGSLSTTTTNLFKAWGVATLVGFTEAIRLASQGLTASKVRLGKKNVTFKLIGTGSLLAAMLLAMASLSVMFAPPVTGTFVIGTAVGIFMSLYAVFGLLFGITYAESMNMVITSGSTRKRGLLMGLFESSIGAGFFIGPYMAGFITEFATFHDSYFVTAILLFLILAACLALAMYMRKPVGRH